MKCRGKFSKLFAVLVTGFIVLSLFTTGIREFGIQSELDNSLSVFGVSTIDLASNPLAYLFHILFILFIISPPLIVLMLVLIWKELRERNKMK